MLRNTISVSNKQLYNGLIGTFNSLGYFGATKLVRANQDVTPPAIQYITADIISSYEKGQPSVGYEELPSLLLLESVRGWYEKTVSFTVYKDTDLKDAVDIGEEIVLYLKSARIQQALSVLGIGFVRSSVVRGFAEDTKAAREHRAQVDIVFNVHLTVTSEIEQIEEAEIVACYEDSARPPIINIVTKEA